MMARRIDTGLLSSKVLEPVRGSFWGLLRFEGSKAWLIIIIKAYQLHEEPKVLKLLLPPRPAAP
jgi:hypothetical protein